MRSIPNTDFENVTSIYTDQVRVLRTRSYELDVPARENTAEILHTLLGIELKVGRRRFACPDLATARYISIFARLGCREFAVPYDITKISTIADELETAFQQALLKVEKDGGDVSEAEKKQRRSALFKSIRSRIAKIGPGDKMPEFKQSTKQRSS